MEDDADDEGEVGASVCVGERDTEKRSSSTLNAIKLLLLKMVKCR